METRSVELRHNTQTPKRVNFASTPISSASPFVACFDRESFEQHLVDEQVRRHRIGRPSFIPDDYNVPMEMSDGAEVEKADVSTQTGTRCGAHLDFSLCHHRQALMQKEEQLEVVELDRCYLPRQPTFLFLAFLP